MSDSSLVVLNTPDSELIERFRAGEHGVFDVLYSRYRARIHGVIANIVSNREDAIDLTQEVFFKAYQGLGRFKGDSKFYSWLYRIAVNQCIDYIRQQSRCWATMDDITDPFSGPGIPDRSIHPAAALEREEFYEQLEAAMAALPPGQRRVFVLRYNEQLSLKAIADRLERSIGTIKAHLFQARRNLRKLIEPYFKDDLPVEHHQGSRIESQK